MSAPSVEFEKNFSFYKSKLQGKYTAYLKYDFVVERSLNTQKTIMILRRNNFKCVNKSFPNGLICIRSIRQLLSYFIIGKYIILDWFSKRENRIIIIKIFNYLYNYNDLKIKKKDCSLGSPAAVAAQSIVVNLLFIFCNIITAGQPSKTIVYYFFSVSDIFVFQICVFHSLQM